MTHQLFTREKIEPILIFIYEFEMLNATFLLWDIKDNHYRRSAILESFLLHARNLVEFFESSGKFSDDLTISDFTGINGGKMQGINLPFSRDFMTGLNKHLAHISKTRLNLKPGWDLRSIRLEINNQAQGFIQNCHRHVPQ